MPKYILRKGEREQAFQGCKIEARGCCNVTIRDSVMFYDEVIVDTGDLSMQTWVDIGMLEEVKEEQEIDLLVSGYALMVDESELEKMDAVLVGDIDQVVASIPEIVESEAKVFVEENKAPEIKSDIVVDSPIPAKALDAEKPMRRYGRRGK